MLRLTIVTVVVALGALALVFELMRRRRLRQKYALLWVVVAGATALLAVFPELLARGAETLGIAVPSNLLFLVSLVILFGVSLQLSIEVGVLEEQSRRLAEEVGALRLRLEDLEPHPEAPAAPPSQQRPHEPPVAADRGIDRAGDRR